MRLLKHNPLSSAVSDAMRDGVWGGLKRDNAIAYVTPRRDEANVDGTCVVVDDDDYYSDIGCSNIAIPDGVED